MSTTTVVHPGNGPTATESANAELVAAAYRALAAGDMAAFLNCLSPAITWTVAAGSPTAGIYYGGEEVLAKAMGPLALEWEDFTVAPEEICPTGDRVFVTGRYTGEHRVTGKIGIARFVHIWHVEDGAAVEFETVFDTHPIREAAK
ncbi:nuclear transport factor 2 family protein [Streptomyces sp. NBC_00878]|uniref:nuclear transport factor 2 family protein n=1 Tax=Streptomyces sp. NBC_00878 TaxID=2975854 RepID=UPI002255C712|nr:nuclear transport factor 2 family protein [Streptomyces sp. NBC_00878]MCX4908984.1 nuclear transport factor 2 family protein [Streptomyces sp. NBC_00878]